MSLTLSLSPTLYAPCFVHGDITGSYNSNVDGGCAMVAIAVSVDDDGGGDGDGGGGPREIVAFSSTFMPWSVVHRHTTAQKMKIGPKKGNRSQIEIFCWTPLFCKKHAKPKI